MAELLRCSFCGKNQHQVRKLVAGPSVYICDECVTIAGRVIQDSDQTSPPTLLRRLVRRLRALSPVGFAAL